MIPGLDRPDEELNSSPKPSHPAGYAPLQHLSRATAVRSSPPRAAVRDISAAFGADEIRPRLDFVLTKKAICYNACTRMLVALHSPSRAGCGIWRPTPRAFRAPYGPFLFALLGQGFLCASLPPRRLSVVVRQVQCPETASKAFPLAAVHLRLARPPSVPGFSWAQSRLLIPSRFD